MSCNRFSAKAVRTIQIPVMFPPGLLKLATKPNLSGSAPVTKTIGMVVASGLGRKHCWWPEREDHGRLALHEISCHCRQCIITVGNPAVFDGYVLTLEITHVRKTAAERSIEAHGNCLPQAAEITDHRHRRLLRARPKRPRRRRPAEKRDELAPPCMSRKQHSEG